MSLIHKIILIIQNSNIGQSPHWQFDENFVFKIALACLAGLLIGLEREYKGKDAGLKTNMLVAVGACAFISVSLLFQNVENTDLTRVLSQVVTGVGFLGAGVILKEGGTVKGLTTAATVWCSASAGCIAALFQITELLSFVGLVVIINTIFGIVDSKVNKEDTDDNSKSKK